MSKNSNAELLECSNVRVQAISIECQTRGATEWLPSRPKTSEQMSQVLSELILR